MRTTINGFASALVVAAALSFLSCGNSSTPVDSRDDEETEAEYADNEPVALEEEPDENEGEVWTDIGGIYKYCGGDTEIIVTSLGRESIVNIGGKDFKAAIDVVTGRINATDADGNLVFSGFMYQGAEVLKGNLRGDSIRLEGVIESDYYEVD